MSRRRAREIVLCLIFEKDYHSDVSPVKMYEQAVESGEIDRINNFLQNNEDNENNTVEKLTENDCEYIKKIYFGIFDKIEQIDDLIAETSISWKNNRISKISMSVLRIAVYEILYVEDVPESAAVNEAVELSKKYDNADAYTFVNGVLGAVIRNVK